MNFPSPLSDITPDAVTPMWDGRPARRAPGPLETVLQAASRLAVLLAFVLAVLLILAHRV